MLEFCCGETAAAPELDEDIEESMISIGKPEVSLDSEASLSGDLHAWYVK